MFGRLESLFDWFFAVVCIVVVWKWLNFLQLSAVVNELFAHAERTSASSTHSHAL